MFRAWLVLPTSFGFIMGNQRAMIGADIVTRAQTAEIGILAILHQLYHSFDQSC